MIKEKFKQQLSNTTLGKDISQLGLAIASGNYVKAAFTVIKSKKLRNFVIFSFVFGFLFSAIPLFALSGAMFSTIMERPMEDFKPEQIQQFKDQASAWEHTIRWISGYDEKGNPIWTTGLDADQIRQVNEKGVNLSWGLIAALKEFGAKDSAEVAKELSPTHIEFEQVEKVTQVYINDKLISTQKNKHWVLTKIVTYNGIHNFSLQSFTTVTTRTLSVGEVAGIAGEGGFLVNGTNGATMKTIVSDMRAGDDSWTKDYTPLYNVEKPLGITKNDEDQKLLFRQAILLDPTFSDPLVGILGGDPNTYARSVIPADLLPLYMKAGQKYGIPWNVLAAIHKIETNFSRGNSPTSSAGAEGPMQFMPSTFAAYAVDGDGDGRTDIQNVADAIFSAAHMLAEDGYARDPRGAIYAYNHSDEYVNNVLDTARKFSDYGPMGMGADSSPLGADRYQRVMSEALKYQGEAYVFGGASPQTGFDCSGLVQWVYAKVGISLPRTAQQQYNATAPISQENARPGDLVFFANTYDAGGDTVTHVGIYVGNGQMYDSDDSGVGYHNITSGYWLQHLYGFGRVKG